MFAEFKAVQTDSELGKCVPDHAFSHGARAINC